MIRSNGELTHAGYRFQYDYQRIKLLLTETNPLLKIYCGLQLRNGIKSFGFFTSSGQGAISVLFDALRMIWGNFRIVLNDTAYWETLDYMRTFGFAPANRATGSAHSVFYLDSSTEEPTDVETLARKIKSADLFAIDSTCYLLSAGKLAELVSLATKLGKPCVLLRSHMKLDCMGTEYGRLGSFVLAYDGNLPRKKREFCRRLADEFTHLSKLYGTFASLSQVYPFLSSSSFHAVNDRRICLVQQNTRHTAMELKRHLLATGSKLSLRSFEHNLFFWITMKQSLNAKKTERILNRLGSLMTTAKLPYRFVASYPWDFIGVTYFAPGQFGAKGRESCAIRLSIPDFDAAMAAKAKDTLIHWTDLADWELKKG